VKVWALALLLLATSAFAAGAPYPRIWSYRATTSQGQKLLTGADLYQPIDETAVRDLARWSITSPGMAPYVNIHGRNRPDVPARLRYYNFGTMTLGYMVMQSFFDTPPDAHAPTDSTFTADYTRYFPMLDRNPPSTWIYEPASNDASFPYGVNWGNREFCDSLTTLITNALKQRDARGQYTLDGILFDYFNRSPFGSGSFDLTRAGYANGAEMDSAFTRSMARLCDAIKVARPDAKIFTNAIGVIPVTTMTDAYFNRFHIDGDLVEGFNDESTLTTFAQALEFTSRTIPSYKLVKGELLAGGTPNTATNCKKARFLLGTTCLADGWAFMGQGADNRTYEGWYDEYSVNYKSGTADTSGAYVGWLGFPLESYRALANGCYSRRFTRGMVIVNPTLSTQTVSMDGGRYKRITGVIDPTTNNGTVCHDVRLTTHDAIFLVKFGNKPNSDFSSP